MRGGRERRKQVSRCRCLRALKECLREDRITNGSIRGELKIYSIKNQLGETEIKQREHI
jgi:hypothetical protein